MKLDLRTVRAIGLIAWGALFGWLWLTGESVRYLGPRTQWVVPVGAVGLTLAAAGYLRATRHEPLARARPLELLGLVALIVPILAAATLAHAQLGSLAASNKLSSRGIDPSALARLASRDAHDIGFLQLNAAGRDSGLSRELGLSQGSPVRLLGFVSSEPSGGAPYELSRFYITCCVADAVPVGVHVLKGATGHVQVRRNDWLDVTGILNRGDREWVVHAVRVRHVDAPSDPYLSFAP
jgi:putative membrane protein